MYKSYLITPHRCQTTFCYRPLTSSNSVDISRKFLFWFRAKKFPERCPERGQCEIALFSSCTAVYVQKTNDCLASFLNSSFIFIFGSIFFIKFTQIIINVFMYVMNWREWCHNRLRINGNSYYILSSSIIWIIFNNPTNILR